MTRFSAGDRPPRPPINNLRQIRDVPGYCRQPWELAFMGRALPLAEQALGPIPDVGISLADVHLHNTRLAAGLLIRRIGLSIEELAGAIQDERQGVTQSKSSTPLSERQFTFGDIAYLAASSMLELGLGSVVNRPGPGMRRQITQHMLYAGPAVCEAFNAAVTILDIPTQRQALSPGNMEGAPLPLRTAAPASDNLP